MDSALINSAVGEQDLVQLYVKYPILKETALAFNERKQILFSDSRESLYLHQASVAIVNLDESSPTWVGSDDATSCHHLVLVSSKHVLFVHMDHDSRVPKVTPFISRNFDNREAIDCYLVGGFTSKASLALTIFKLLCRLPYNFQLKLLCVAELNTKKENLINHPLHLGIAFNTRTCCLEPARFALSARNPVGVLQHLISMVNSEDLVSTYETNANKLRLALFCTRPLLFFADNCDPRENSTTPEQEPETYIQSFNKLKEFIRECAHRITTEIHLSYSFTNDGWKMDPNAAEEHLKQLRHIAY
ncbi:N-terminal asparagine [Cichlidogyrus casuarinus]|uniref:N-terminal asparagine n=1 Tax=Cichlidogyrus casuarinus TaxID=1844966 RepID=A0ABD2QJ04_9PLAT